MNFTNVTNQSVLDNLGHFFGNFIPNVFGGNNAAGEPIGQYLFFIVILIFFIALLFYLGASLDLAVVVLFPLVLILATYGYVPTPLIAVTLIIAIGFVFLAYRQVTNR